MNQRVLIAYATKYGATKEIAEAVGETLQAAGLAVDVLPAADVVALDDYSAVILGSAVYAGSWRGDAVTFLETHEAALAARPTWIFSGGPTGEGDPVEMMKGWNMPDAQKPLIERIQPRSVAFFHGVIDTGKLNLAERLIIRAFRAPAGDFRDWDSINAWATSIATALKPETA